MSSRHEIPAKQPGHRVVVGWDNPTMTYFAQVERVQQSPFDTSDSIILWLGDTAHQHPHAETMERDLAPYAELAPSILQQLRQDRAADLDRAPTPLQRRLNDLLEPESPAKHHPDDFAVWPEGGWATLGDLRHGRFSNRSDNYEIVRRSDHARLQELGMAAGPDTPSPDRTPRSLKQQSAESEAPTKWEIIYREREMDRVQRPTGIPLAVIEARDANETMRIYRDKHRLEFAGYETMAVPVRPTFNPTMKPERIMSDNTRGAPQPQGPVSNVQSQEQPTASGRTPGASERTEGASTQSANQAAQNSPRQADDEMRKLLQDLAQASTTLGTAELGLQANIANLGISVNTRPELLQQQDFRRNVAYALQDMKRATGRQFLPDGALRTELEQLATTMPGLKNPTVVELLKATPAIFNQGLVTDVRGAAQILASAGDRQSAPKFREIVDAVQNRYRLYSEPNANYTPAPDASPAPAVVTKSVEVAPTDNTAEAQPAAAPRHETLNAALQRQGEQQGGRPQPQQRPGESVGERWTRALRAPIPTGAEVVWPLPAESMTDRISRFEARLAEGKTLRLLQDAEKSGTRAIEATEQFIQGPGRGILGKMESAASTEPGGMQTVLREMQPGGRYANLRTEFDNAYQQDQIFRGAYDKMVDSNTRFGKDRDAITSNYTLRNLNPAELDGRFQRAEESLGEALSKVPGKEPGKSALDEMAEKLAEILRAAVDRIKGMFRPGMHAEAQPQSRPAPSMSP